MLFVGLLGFLVAMSSLFTGGYLWVYRSDVGHASVRWAACLTVVALCACFVFQTTLLLGIFFAPVVFVALMLCAAPMLILGRDGVHRNACFEQFKQDIQALSPPRFLLPVFGLTGFHFFRNSLVPPMAWDDLTYHLVRAAFWCQSGNVNIIYEAPGAWEYYRWFPLMGEAPQTLGMLFSQSDLMVSVIGVTIWSGIVLGAFSIARQLDADSRISWILALAAATFPAITGHIYTAYVDNFVLLLQVLAVSLLLRGYTTPERQLLALSLVAIVLSVAVKPTAGLFGGTLLLAILFTAWKHKSVGFTIGLGIILGTAIMLPQSLWLAQNTGSPIYPFNYFDLPHSTELARLNAAPAVFTPLVYFKGLFVGGYASFLQHRNFGLGFGPAILLGLLAIKHIRRTDSRIIVPLVVMGGTGIVGLALSMTGTGWNGARYVSIGVVLFCVAGGVIGRAGYLLGIAALLLNTIYLLPINIGPAEYPMLLVGVVTLAPAIIITAVVAKFRVEYRFEMIGLAVVCWCVWTAFAAEPIRSIFRYDVYRDAEAGLSFTNIPVTGVHALSMRSAAIWEATDHAEGQKIAVAAGWDGKGHNWFVYPLFGSRLQNRLVYVDPAIEQTTLYSDRTPQELSESNWLENLAKANIDKVVMMAPLTAEAIWITNHADLFQLIAVGSDPRNFVVGRLKPELHSTGPRPK